MTCDHGNFGDGKAARRKFAALQTVILNERRMPGVKDLNWRSPPTLPSPCVPPHPRSSQIGVHFTVSPPGISSVISFFPLCVLCVLCGEDFGFSDFWAKLDNHTLAQSSPTKKARNRSCSISHAERKRHWSKFFATFRKCSCPCSCESRCLLRLSARRNPSTGDSGKKTDSLSSTSLT